MKPTNLLFIFSDQHCRSMHGCYGHPMPVSPNLDALAERGTRFTSAYTNSPLCMPARASMATGRYVHQVRAWDNAHPYCGEDESWHHRLREQGFRIDAIGKLHFRGAKGDDNGFTSEHFPLNRRGAGDVPACKRGDMPERTLRIDFDAAGPGDSSYIRYDRRNAAYARRWIAGRAEETDKPWTLFLGIGSPHTPFIAPPEQFRRFDPDRVPLPPCWHPDDWPQHPALAFLRDRLDFDTPFPEEVIRKANASYLGLCAFVDDLVGQVLAALDESGQRENTRVIYSTDHGESMGARGVIGKFTMYDESAAVPLIVAGPDIPENRECGTPVSLVDIFPTALECVGAESTGTDEELPGKSLLQIANEPDSGRTVLSEYHALASRHAVYMLRDRYHKYVHYHNDPPQLFAADDAEERRDLSTDPQYAATIADMETRLCQFLDPEAVDLQAKEDQRNYVELHGTAPVQWPPKHEGPTITYTTIPPELDPALAEDPATRSPDWQPTRDLPDDWQA